MSWTWSSTHSCWPRCLVMLWRRHLQDSQVNYLNWNEVKRWRSKHIPTLGLWQGRIVNEIMSLIYPVCQNRMCKNACLLREILESQSSYHSCSAPDSSRKNVRRFPMWVSRFSMSDNIWVRKFQVYSTGLPEYQSQGFPKSYLLMWPGQQFWLPSARSGPWELGVRRWTLNWNPFWCNSL